jgi:ABC-2 type transport system ATP-binding protein
MIQTVGLTKYYKKRSRGILDVNLDIRKGEIFGFIGPNGAGKSTTVRTLLNLIFPTEGSASVNGLDVVRDTVEIRKHIGYIPSEVNYYGDMTVQDFLVYAASFYGEKKPDAMHALAERLELDLTRKIENLSYGNKRKVAIVQALQHDPDILILDEPTAGLDPLMQNTFFNLLEEEKNKGKTIFFSSHILSEVQRICDRVGIIKEGRLIRVETIDEIMKTRAKKVRIKTDQNFLKEDDDIVNLQRENDHLSFVYTGTIDRLLSMLQGQTIHDLSIVDPTLEEIFMHYYERDDDQ